MLIAIDVFAPAAIDLKSIPTGKLEVETADGEFTLARAPFPRLPDEPRPQANSCPVEVKASEWFSPAEIATTDSPDIGPLAATKTGIARVVLLPSPTVPCQLSPQP